MNYQQYEAAKPKDYAEACDVNYRVLHSGDPLIGTEAEPSMDIKHSWIRTTELYPEEVAYRYKEKHSEPFQSITFGQARADSDALGTELYANETLSLRGKHIAICAENRYEWCMSYLAVINGVGVVVPIDKELSEEEITHIFAEGEVEAVICSQKYLAEMERIRTSGQTNLRVIVSMDLPPEEDGKEESGGPVLSWKACVARGKERLQNGDTSYTDILIDNRKMAVLLFTSGTTGNPKGVMISHWNLSNNLMVSPAVFEFRHSDVFLSFLPLNHTYECTCTFLMAVHKGNRIIFCEGLKYLQKNMQEEKPNLFLGVPLIFESFYKRIWKTAEKNGKAKQMRTVLNINKWTKKIGIDLVPLLLKDVQNAFGGNLKRVIVGGAAIDPKVLEGLEEFGITALQGYGLTECAPLCALNPYRKHKAAAAGYKMPTIEYRVDNPDPETGIGEIVVKGNQVMLGYYKRPDLTAEVLKDGWYYTGDLGYFDGEGFLFLTGRKKSVIITKNGKNVFPEELEYLLGRIPMVEESFVFQGDSVDGEDTTIAAAIRVRAEEVETLLGKDAADEQVLQALWKEVDSINETLPLYKRIKHIGLRKTPFDKTSAQKIRRANPDNEKFI